MQEVEEVEEQAVLGSSAGQQPDRDEDIKPYIHRWGRGRWGWGRGWVEGDTGNSSVLGMQRVGWGAPGGRG